MAFELRGRYESEIQYSSVNGKNVECCGGSSFFQFYQLSSYGRLIGNYYRAERGQTKKVGTAIVNRK